MTRLIVPEGSARDASRWRAVAQRDARADGAFYVANRRTGTYCRPSCASRHPEPSQVVFLSSLAAARAGHWRACRRCTPEFVTRREWVMARVLSALERPEPAPSLARLADEVRLTPSHLQRLFTRAVGLSPKRYALACCDARFRAHLSAGSSVTDALYAAGYPAPRSMYRRATDTLGMTPSAYRAGGAGEVVLYTLSRSAGGRAVLARTGRGVCLARWDRTADLRAQFHQAWLVRDDARLRPDMDLLKDQIRTLHAARNPEGFAAVQRLIRGLPGGAAWRYADVADRLTGPADERQVARLAAAPPAVLVLPTASPAPAGGTGYRLAA